jgi:hypothetical protein
VKFKLDENLPVSSVVILTSVGHDVDTVTQEGLVGAPDRDVVAAATVGYSAVISSAVMPTARQSRITLTGTRVPAITAWPCITWGSAEIISNWSAVTI